MNTGFPGVPAAFILAVSAGLAAAAGAAQGAGVGAATSAPRWRPGLQAFELKEGRGTAVCEAYVEMLRSIEFEDPPYCSRRPDIDQRKFGFEPLGWKKLEPQVDLDLRQVVPHYFRNGRLDYLQKAWSWEEAARAINPSARSHLYRDINVTARERHREIAKDATLDSQRAPLTVDRPFELAADVDIDNDGSPERLVIWPSEGRRCGAVIHEEPRIFGRHGVILKAGGEFDARKTDEVFRHADNYRVLLRDPKSGQVLPYPTLTPRYLVQAPTITKYQGIYLFDGLIITTPHDSRSRKQQNDSIGVFEHRNGITATRCEIAWQGSARR